MAAYYAECQGARGPVSRLGGADHGVRALVKSWTHTLRTSMRKVDGADSITILLDSPRGTLAHWAGTPEQLAAKLKD